MSIVAQAAKAALVGENNVLAALLPTYDVSYSPPRDVNRNLVYGSSAITGPVELKAMAAGGRVKRSEELTFTLTVRAWLPGESTSEASEARAAAAGDVIALYLAANWTLGGIADLKSATVAALDLDGWVDDDGAGGVLTITVRVMSYLS